MKETSALAPLTLRPPPFVNRALHDERQEEEPEIWEMMGEEEGHSEEEEGEGITISALGPTDYKETVLGNAAGRVVRTPIILKPISEEGKIRECRVFRCLGW